jgi:HNH endonuclease
MDVSQLPGRSRSLPGNRFLRDLAEYPEFRNLLGLKEPHKRMTDIELTLRFMAFRDQTYINYPDKKTKQFLNRQMELGQVLKAREREKAAKDFRQAVDLVLTVFGSKYAFKKFNAGTSADPNGRWSRGNNRALIDVQLWGFTQFKKGDVVRNADAVREAAIELMGENEEFADVVVNNTSDKRRLRRRFELWEQMLRAVIGDSTQGRRLFDRRVKEQLFDANPECQDCGQAIRDIDDAHVDHIDAYAAGGKTVHENAALLHRFCNLSKGKRASSRVY